ncbi:hypothetical protein B0H19DRAFT_1065497 [Mycena capillaripes]|nr:hypothetical protein B0H19DRAFT_1065497 [Mycena capillaripes]
MRKPVRVLAVKQREGAKFSFEPEPKLNGNALRAQAKRMREGVGQRPSARYGVASQLGANRRELNTALEHIVYEHALSTRAVCPATARFAFAGHVTPPPSNYLLSRNNTAYLIRAPASPVTQVLPPELLARAGHNVCTPTLLSYNTPSGENGASSMRELASASLTAPFPYTPTPSPCVIRGTAARIPSAASSLSPTPYLCLDHPAANHRKETMPERGMSAPPLGLAHSLDSLARPLERKASYGSTTIPALHLSSTALRVHCWEPAAGGTLSDISFTSSALLVRLVLCHIPIPPFCYCLESPRSPQDSSSSSEEDKDAANYSLPALSEPAATRRILFSSVVDASPVAHIAVGLLLVALSAGRGRWAMPSTSNYV